MVEKIGLNLTAFNDVEPLNVSINPSNIINQIPAVANATTNNNLAYVIFFTMFFVLYWVLSERFPLGDFGYDDARALSIALGICTIIGITQFEIGFLTEFRALALMFVLFIVVFVIIMFYENKE